MKSKKPKTLLTAPGETQAARTRTPTANAEKTGSTAIPRSGTPSAPSRNAAGNASAALTAQQRTKRRNQSRRPGSLLTGSVVPAELNARTLLGYS